MARAFASLMITLFVVSAALLLGLAGSSLRTGLLDPLDWLLPCVVAIIVLALWTWRGTGAGSGGKLDRRGEGAISSDLQAQAIPGAVSANNDTRPNSNPSWAAITAIWAVVTVPPLVLLGRAGTYAPSAGMGVLAACLAVTGLACTLVRGRSRLVRGVTFAVLIILALLIPRFAANADGAPQVGANAERPLVAILTAMPLQGVAMGAAQGIPAIESVGLQSPLWQVLESHFRLHALDGLDGDALTGMTTLLLAQPRSLTPQELVALDAWVRTGGRAVILADPLLHWPDPRPLAHPDRAPLTSLLDPLLAHWGVRLEAAEFDADGDPVERRQLESGSMLQLAGSSRFVLLDGKSSCISGDAGLLAHCRIGNGSALLVADADWIDDSHWTLTPDRPADRSGWTSDALDVLSSWLRGGEAEVSHFTGWVAGKEALVGALRAALFVGLLLCVMFQLVGRNPRNSQMKYSSNADHMRNMGETKVEAP